MLLLSVGWPLAIVAVVVVARVVPMVVLRLVVEWRRGVILRTVRVGGVVALRVSITTSALAALGWVVLVVVLLWVTSTFRVRRIAWHHLVVRVHTTTFMLVMRSPGALSCISLLPTITG